MKQNSRRWLPGIVGSSFIGLRTEITCSLRLSTREHRTVTFNPKFIPSDEHIIEDVTLRKGGVIIVFRTGGLLSDDFKLMAVPMNFINPRVYPRLEERAKKWVSAKIFSKKLFVTDSDPRHHLLTKITPYFVQLNDQYSKINLYN